MLTLFSTPTTAIEAMTWAIAFAVVQQTLELLALRSAMADQGVWAWPILRREFAGGSRLAQAVTDGLLRYPNILGVLVIRLGAALLVFVAPPLPCLLIMLATTLLISIRWRGTFNGGSDSMTMIILSALTIDVAFGDSNPMVGLACVWYVALAAVNSYALAGFAKLRESTWRSGAALGVFVNTSVHGPLARGRSVLRRRVPARVISWVVLALECGFPLVLVDPAWCYGFITLALAFHIANAYVFGLDRFLFVWVATYPALLCCSGSGLPGAG